jgi:polyisoprenoid-binding protein YceI
MTMRARGASWWWLAFAAFPACAQNIYRLDPVSTTISFNIRHFGVLWVSAHFPDFSGRFVLDRRGPSSRVDVSVQMASIDCSDQRWNERLRSAEWLDVKRYPQMTFHADQVDFDGDGRALAHGQLSLHGLTRTVGLEITQLNCAPQPSRSQRCSFEAHTRVKRSDYDIPHGFWTGGDQVDIAISGVGSSSVGGADK